MYPLYLLKPLNAKIVRIKRGIERATHEQSAASDIPALFNIQLSGNLGLTSDVGLA